MLRACAARLRSLLEQFMLCAFVQHNVLKTAGLVPARVQSLGVEGHDAGQPFVPGSSLLRVLPASFLACGHIRLCHQISPFSWFAGGAIYFRAAPCCCGCSLGALHTPGKRQWQLPVAIRKRPFVPQDWLCDAGPYYPHGRASPTTPFCRPQPPTFPRMHALHKHCRRCQLRGCFPGEAVGGIIITGG